MSKQEFLAELKAKLSGLPQQEARERLDFYSEMIDDRIEEGQTEEVAVLSIGSVDEIAEQIIAEIPFSKIAKERIKPKRQIRAWEIVLLALGSPIWLSLAIAAIAVVISLYAVLWSLVGCVWAVFASLAACGLAGVVMGAAFAVVGYGVSGLFLIGAGIILAGLSIFLFLGCMSATKGIVWITKQIALGIKKCFIKKEDTK